MKKAVLTIFIAMVMVVMVFFTSSCKKAELEFSWNKVEGIGVYNSVENTSTLKLEGWLKIDQSSIVKTPFQVSIIDWVYYVTQNNTIVLEIPKDGYHSVIGDVFLNTSELTFDWLYVYIETTTPKPGDLFNGMEPNQLELIFVIQDDQGNFYEQAVSAPFNYTRID
jgi:hypothetical protein